MCILIRKDTISPPLPYNQSFYKPCRWLRTTNDIVPAKLVGGHEMTRVRVALQPVASVVIEPRTPPSLHVSAQVANRDKQTLKPRKAKSSAKTSPAKVSNVILDSGLPNIYTSQSKALANMHPGLRHACAPAPHCSPSHSLHLLPNSASIRNFTSIEHSCSLAV